MAPGDALKIGLPENVKSFPGRLAAARHPAHDNLDSMHEWAGDPIGSQYNLWPPTVL